MKTHTVLTSYESSVGVTHSENGGMATYMGASVLIYVLLLCALAPRKKPLVRYKASL